MTEARYGSWSVRTASAASSASNSGPFTQFHWT